jgi:hypothetical protein
MSGATCAAGPSCGIACGSVRLGTPGRHRPQRRHPMLTILLIVVLILLLTGGIGYGRRGRRG